MGETGVLNKRGGTGIFKLAFQNIKRHFRFYGPFLLILLVVVFVFCSLLALA